MVQEKHFEDSFTGVEGVNLYYQSWLPAGEPRAYLLIAHGLGEHSGRYGHVADFFTDKGVAVFALDFQGHGKSGGKRGHVRDFKNFARDVEQLRQIVVVEYGAKPVFLFGHSLGGLIAFDYALDHQSHLAALVLSAPTVGIKMKVPAWKEKLARSIVGLVPSLTLNNGLDAAWLSHDEDVVNAYRNDPLVHPKASLSLFLGMVSVGKRCAEQAATLSLPTMLVFGGQDQIVSFEPAHQAFLKINSADKKELIYENAFHEIHNDDDKFDELAAMWEWLKPKIV
jgi:alpha-beta hydrolase superfamily lysophospholipase